MNIRKPVEGSSYIYRYTLTDFQDYLNEAIDRIEEKDQIYGAIDAFKRIGEVPIHVRMFGRKPEIKDLCRLEF
jgi:hypothetical protein